MEKPIAPAGASLDAGEGRGPRGPREGAGLEPTCCRPVGHPDLVF